MKILALGGCGQDGVNALRALVKSSDVSSIVIGDIDIDNASRLKEELGDKLSAIYVDANDHQALVKVMDDSDLVLSFVGPYNIYGVKILKAAIEAKKDFIDINDDFDDTADALALHDEAKEAGITAIIGLGASPGIFNILARMGAEKLDEVDDIHMRWNVSSTDLENPESNSIISHLLHICSGTHPQYLDGKWTEVEAMSGSETIHFDMLGDVEVYYVGHPEPVTLPRYIKGVKNVTVKGGVHGLSDLVRQLRELGLLSTEALNVQGSKVVPRDFSIELISALPETDPIKSPPPYTGGYVTVQGRKAEASIKYTYSLVEPLRLGPCSGIPACVGALMLVKGSIQQKGVFAPEGCIDPQPFMSELARYGIKFAETKEVGLAL